MPPKYHPDFSLPWCQRLLTSNISVVEIPARTASPDTPASVSNSMFLQTLYTDSGIRAQINFQRPTQEPDAITSTEYCYLLSIGTGVDGKLGRAHGGFNALIMDQMLGSVSAQATDSIAPATATMTVDYKAPIETPSVVLCRGWAIEVSGRKIWAKAVVQDGMGKTLAAGKALFVKERESKA